MFFPLFGTIKKAIPLFLREYRLKNHKSPREGALAVIRGNGGYPPKYAFLISGLASSSFPAPVVTTLPVSKT